jgi:molybdopterin converting factor small subunit
LEEEIPNKEIHDEDISDREIQISNTKSIIDDLVDKLKGKKKKISKLKRTIKELETLDNVVKSENEKFREHSTKIREKYVELRRSIKP